MSLQNFHSWVRIPPAPPLTPHCVFRRDSKNFCLLLLHELPAYVFAMTKRSSQAACTSLRRIATCSSSDVRRWRMLARKLQRTEKKTCKSVFPPSVNSQRLSGVRRRTAKEPRWQLLPPIETERKTLGLRKVDIGCYPCQKANQRGHAKVAPQLLEFIIGNSGAMAVVLLGAYAVWVRAARAFMTLSPICVSFASAFFSSFNVSSKIPATSCSPRFRANAAIEPYSAIS